MGSSATPTLLSGIVVTDPRFTWSSYAASASIVTESGPLPGVPAADGDTEAVLECTGDTSSGDVLQLIAVSSGQPGPDNARTAWRYSGDTSYNGWDPPCSLTGFDFVDRSTTSHEWRFPHAVTLASGVVLCAVQKEDQKVYVWKRSTAGVWSSHSVYDRGSAYTYGAYPTLCPLPSGRVMLYFWREHGSSNYGLAYYSDDEGATWTVASKSALPSAIATGTYTPGRLRAIALDGSVLLLAHLQTATEDQIHQWASLDGVNFTLVDTLTGGLRGFPDLAVCGGTIVMAYVTGSATSGSDYPAAYRIIGSPWQTITDGTSGYCQDDADTMEWTTVSGGVFAVGGLALWCDEDGVLWVAGVDQDAGALQEVLARYSTDAGITWQSVQDGPAAADGVAIWRGQDTSTHPDPSFSVTALQGRGLMLHQFAAAPGTADSSLACAYLGGHTTVCLPQQDSVETLLQNVTGWTITYLPYDLPANTGDGVPVWTTPGTGTEALTSSGLQLNDVQYYATATADITGSTLTEGVMVLAQVTLTTNEARIELRNSDATPLEYEVYVVIKPTYIQLFDHKAGAQVARVTTTDAVTHHIQILAHLAGASAYVWYRVVDETGARAWIAVGHSTTLTSSAANNGNRARWGSFNVGDLSYWKMCCVNADSYVGVGLAGGQTNPGDLLGRALTATPVWVDEGVSVHAVDGPALSGESWTITPRAEYPVSNLFGDVAPSPRRPWRSEDDNVQMELVVGMAGLASTTPMLGSLLAVYLGNANFGQAELHGASNLGVYTKICDIDLRKTGLKWTRSDAIVQPDVSGGSSVGYYLPTNVLADCHIKFDGGAVRRIATNSPGTWAVGSTSLKTRILFDDCTETEGASGTGGEIWLKDGLVIVASTSEWRRFKLVIPAQTTAEGYLELGNWQVGHFVPTGGYLMGTGWGRAQEWACKVEQVEGRAGIRTVQALSPVRRSVEVAFVDGVETSVLTTDGSPNWVIGWTGGDPVVVPADAPWSVPGLLGLLEGAKTPVTYCAATAIPGALNGKITVTDPRLLLHGRIATESIRADTVLGTEGSTELIRVGVLRIEQET